MVGPLLLERRLSILAGVLQIRTEVDGRGVGLAACLGAGAFQQERPHEFLAVDVLDGRDRGDGARGRADVDVLGLCRGLVLNLLHEQLNALAANLVARGRYRSERDRSAPSEWVAIATCYAYLPGDGDAFVDQRRDDARGQHVGQTDDKIGTFVRGALGDLGTDAVAVGGGIPFAGVDDFDLDIGV